MNPSISQSAARTNTAHSNSACHHGSTVPYGTATSAMTASNAAKIVLSSTPGEFVRAVSLALEAEVLAKSACSPGVFISTPADRPRLPTFAGTIRKDVCGGLALSYA